MFDLDFFDELLSHSMKDSLDSNKYGGVINKKNFPK